VLPKRNSGSETREEVETLEVSPLERSKAQRKGPRAPEAKFGWRNSTGETRMQNGNVY
jgi:hypothetical protein